MGALIICMHACRKIDGKRDKGSKERAVTTLFIEAPLLFGHDIMLLWHRNNNHGVPRAGASYCTHYAKTAAPGNDLSRSSGCSCAS